MEISFESIKRVNMATGAKLMDCKQALIDTNGDIEFAIALIREKQSSTPSPSPVRPSTTYSQPSSYRQQSFGGSSSEQLYRDKAARERVLNKQRITIIGFLIVSFFMIAPFILALIVFNMLGEAENIPGVAYIFMGIISFIFLLLPIAVFASSKTQIKRMDEFYNITGFPYEEAIHATALGRKSVEDALASVRFSGNPSMTYRDRVSELDSVIMPGYSSYGQGSSYSPGRYRNNNASPAARVFATLFVLVAVAVGAVIGLDLSGFTNIAVSDAAVAYRETRDYIAEQEESTGVTDIKFKDAEFIFINDTFMNTSKGIEYTGSFIFKIRYEAAFLGMKITVTSCAVHEKGDSDVTKTSEELYSTYKSAISSGDIYGKEGEIMFPELFRFNS